MSNINSVNTGILSGGDLWLHAGEIDNTSGTIVAVGETRVSRTVLNNLDGRLFTDPALVLSLPTLTLPGVRLDDGAPPQVPSQIAPPVNPGQSAAGPRGDAIMRNAPTPAAQNVMPQR